MNMPGHGTSGCVAGFTMLNISAGSAARSPLQPPTRSSPITVSTTAAASSTVVCSASV